MGRTESPAADIQRAHAIIAPYSSRTPTVGRRRVEISASLTRVTINLDLMQRAARQDGVAFANLRRATISARGRRVGVMRTMAPPSPSGGR